MIKTLILLLSFSFAQNGIYDAMAVKKEKAIPFLKSSSCYLAVGKDFDNSKNGYVWPDVLCVLDGKSDMGGVNEVSGCTLMIFNMKTGKFKGTSSRSYGPDGFAIVHKDCNKGGLEALLVRPSVADEMSGKPHATVGETIASGKGTMIQNSYLLYAENDAWKAIYDDLKKNNGKTMITLESQSLTGKAMGKIKGLFGN